MLDTDRVPSPLDEISPRAAVAAVSFPSLFDMPSCIVSRHDLCRHLNLGSAMGYGESVQKRQGGIVRGTGAIKRGFVQ